MSKIKEYTGETVTEMVHRVTWPRWKELQSNTIIVVFASVLISLIIFIMDFVFAEGHVGSVGEGTGIRGFAGITLERLMKNSLNLPFNLLVGSEIFYSTDMAGVGNSSGWAALGLRLDFGF